MAYLSLRLFCEAGGIVRGQSKMSSRELKKKEQPLESALDCRAFTLMFLKTPRLPGILPEVVRESALNQYSKKAGKTIHYVSKAEY